jgi:hypothetical protein
MQKQSTKSLSPKSNSVVYVVEAKLNFFENNGIKKGDQFEIKNKKLIVKKQ